MGGVFFGQKTLFLASRFPWGGGGTPFSANFFLLTFLQAAFRDGGDWGIVPPPIMVIIQ